MNKPFAITLGVLCVLFMLIICRRAMLRVRQVKTFKAGFLRLKVAIIEEHGMSLRMTIRSLP